MTTEGRDMTHVNFASGLKLWSPFFVSGEVTVVRVCLENNSLRENAAFAWLNEAERLRSNRYLPEPRRHFVLCRAALRGVICKQLECRNSSLTFGEGPFGKPFAEVDGRPAAMSFSVSHSGRYGLIAYAPAGQLGVDVEQIAPKRHLHSLIEAVMGPEEQRELAEMQDRERLHQFFRLWTCKEALVKALGTGFSTDISSFQAPLNIRRGETTGIFRFPNLPETTWLLQDISEQGFAATLVSEMPPAASCRADASSQYQDVFHL